MLSTMKINSKHFTWYKDLNKFIVYASDLPDNFHPLNKLKHDSHKIGFDMISQKTGKELTFVFTHTDGIEETEGWNFKSDSRDNFLSKIKVLIIND
jgi:hypothetical protein